jgi:hypothetical protein
MWQFGRGGECGGHAFARRMIRTVASTAQKHPAPQAIAVAARSPSQSGRRRCAMRLSGLAHQLLEQANRLHLISPTGMGLRHPQSCLFRIVLSGAARVICRNTSNACSQRSPQKNAKPIVSWASEVNRCPA